ncbi:MAG: hypothetical protein ABI855_15940 [Bacteroidota bacterium]
MRIHKLYGWLSMLILFLIPFYNHAQQNQNSNKYNTLYSAPEVDSIAGFPGEEYELFKFIEDNFQVSQAIRSEIGTNPMVTIASFLVDTSGNYSDIQFSTLTTQSVEHELIRVLNKMPKWKPAIKNNEKVLSRVFIPIRYVFNDYRIKIINFGTEAIKGSSHKLIGLKITVMFLTIFAFLLISSLH